MNFYEENQKLSESTIIICAIVRDCGTNLKKNIRTIDEICDMAKEYHVVIFENDSVDDTKQILQRWSEKRKNIHISLNEFNSITIPPNNTSVNRFFSRARIEKMAKYRNYYLEYIESNKLESDYIMVIDLDVSKIYLDGVLSSFGMEQNWDCVTANGYIYSPSAMFKKRYNDTYALVEYGKENIPQTEKSIEKNRYLWSFLKPNLPMIKVFSAFGGLAIYKYVAIRNCKYTILKNNDKKVEVRCEHFSICKQMSENGFGNIYINPKMKVEYQPYFFQKINVFFQKIKAKI
jgi:hypothetical protein